jgi:hypothetical protein
MTNRRITVLNEQLEMLEGIGLGAVNQQPRRMVPMAQGYLLYGLATDSSLVHISTAGQVLGVHPLPWPAVHDIHWMAREGNFVHDPKSDLIVYAFDYGNGWLAFELLTLPNVLAGRYLVDLPFPGVVRTDRGSSFSLGFSSGAERSIRGASLADGCLFVVANDVGGSSESIIDIFDVRSSQYAFSHRLPRRIDKIAVSEGSLFALANDPYPVVLRATIGDYDRTCPSPVSDG